MEQHLIIQFERSTGRVAWLPADADGRPLGLAQHGTPAEAATMAGGRRVVALVPSEEVLLVRVALPRGRRSARWLEAVPYALEDRLAGDVESMHFAIGSGRDEQGRVPVAAVSHEWMSAWLGTLREHGIVPHALVPDCLALPFSPGQATVAESDGRTLCRDGDCDGFACETPLFQAMADARTRDGGVRAPPRSPAMEAGLLAAMAPGAVTAPLDLLQGAYRRRNQASLAPWRTPAALAAALVMIAGGNWLYEYVSLSREHDRLRAMIETEFRQVLPDEPMADVRAQIERRLRGSGPGDGEWLHMLDALSMAVPQVDGVELQSLTWRAGSMEVALTAQRAEQLDALQRRIIEAGQDVSIESASVRGDRVDGRLRIGGGG